MSTVQCAQCTACCRNQLIVLLQDDAPNMAFYDFSEHSENGVTLRVLNEKPNGECVHLSATGCTIYEHRPVACRFYDCRMQFKITSRSERRAFENGDVWDEARRRLHTLDVSDIAGLDEYAAKAKRNLRSMRWPDGGS